MTSRAWRGRGGGEIISKQELGGASLWTGARSLTRGHPWLVLDIWKEDRSRAVDARAPWGVRGTWADSAWPFSSASLLVSFSWSLWWNLTEPAEI